MGAARPVTAGRATGGWTPAQPERRVARPRRLAGRQVAVDQGARRRRDDELPTSPGVDVRSTTPDAGARRGLPHRRAADRHRLPDHFAEPGDTTAVAPGRGSGERTWWLGRITDGDADYIPTPPSSADGRASSSPSRAAARRGGGPPVKTRGRGVHGVRRRPPDLPPPHRLCHLRRLAPGRRPAADRADEAVRRLAARGAQGAEDAYVRQIILRAHIDETRRPHRREAPASTVTTRVPASRCRSRSAVRSSRPSRSCR